MVNIFKNINKTQRGNWYVPVSEQMNVNGVNDANQKIFQKNSPLKSMLRENIQNSLDAKDDPSKSVEIEIELDSIKSNDFPEKEAFIKYVNKIKNSKRWKNDSDVKRLVRNIMEAFSKTEMPVLRFSDYNTKGATGATKYQPTNNNPWNLLTSTNNATGNSSKSGSGGSFGVGKNASKVASDINTVFYMTRSDESKNNYQLGSATLASYIEDNNISGNIYTFAAQEDKKPLEENVLKLSSGYSRDTNGTDVFILAFNGIDDLKENATKYILSEFLVSIFLGKLSVSILIDKEKYIINKNNLYNIVEEITSNNDETSKNINYYFSALNEGVKYNLSKELCESFNLDSTDGSIYLVERPGDSAPSTFLMTRETGMTIFTLKRFVSSAKVSGVFIASGKLSVLLRRMEDVTHTQWNPEYFRESDDDTFDISPKQLYSKLIAYIHGVVKDIISQEKDDSVFDSLMNDFIYIPEDTGDDSKKDNDESEIKNHISKVKIKNVGVNKPSTKTKKNKKVVVRGSNSGSNQRGRTKTPDKKKDNKDSKTTWTEVYPNEEFLIPDKEKMNYVFTSSSSLKKSLLIATIVGETKKEVPTLIEATLDGKKLRHSSDSKSVLIYIDDQIEKNTQPKISMKFKEGTNLGLEVRVLKGVNK